MITSMPGAFFNHSWAHSGICWNSKDCDNTAQLSTSSDDGGWSLGAPGKGSGWGNTTPKADSAANCWEGSPTMTTTVQGEPVLQSVSSDSKPASGSPWLSSLYNNGTEFTWPSGGGEDAGSVNPRWTLPPPESEFIDSKAVVGSGLAFAIDPDKSGEYLMDMKWSAAGALRPPVNLTSPQPMKEAYVIAAHPLTIPQVPEIIASVSVGGTAETGYIPFGNPLKQVHSSDRRWSSKDCNSMGSTPPLGGMVRSPQQRSGGSSFSTGNSRMYLGGKMSGMQSRLPMGRIGDNKSSGIAGNPSYIRGGAANMSSGGSNKVKPINIYSNVTATEEKEPSGWGDLPSPNADLVDNGTSDWVRSAGRDRQRMIKSQLDGINGWDMVTTVAPTGSAHWASDKDAAKTAGWGELSRQTGQQNGDDSAGWCVVNSKPNKMEVINRHLQTLVEMGFKKEDCEKVLKTNNYNLEQSLGDLLALACTEELSLSATSGVLTTTNIAKLQSTAVTASAAIKQSNNTIKSNLTASQPMQPTANVMYGDALSSSVDIASIASNVTKQQQASVDGGTSLSAVLSPSYVSSIVTPSATQQAVNSLQSQLGAKVMQPPMLSTKLLSDLSTNPSPSQQRQQLLSHLKLVNYHLSFLTKMQQTLFQKLSILNETSTVITGLPPPLIQQQKQDVLLQLQQVNTMIVMYSQQAALLKQLASNNGSGGGNGAANGYAVTTTVASSTTGAKSKPVKPAGSADTDKEPETAGKEKSQEEEVSSKAEESSAVESSALPTVSTDNSVIVAKTEKVDCNDDSNDTVSPVVMEMPVLKEDISEESAVPGTSVGETVEESTPSDSTEPSDTSSTIATASGKNSHTVSTGSLASVSSFDDDNFPQEFQPGKPWVPRMQQAESNQLMSTANSSMQQLQAVGTIVTSPGKPPVATTISAVSKSLASSNMQAVPPNKAGKFPPFAGQPVKMGMAPPPPQSSLPPSQAPVRPPGMLPMTQTKYVPSTRQIQKSINNLMFAQLGNNAAVAAAARKGNFSAPNIPGGFLHGTAKKPVPGMHQFHPAPPPPPPQFMNGINFSGFPPPPPQHAMPPPLGAAPPQMGAANFQIPKGHQQQLYMAQQQQAPPPLHQPTAALPHPGIKKSHSYSGMKNATSGTKLQPATSLPLQQQQPAFGSFSSTSGGKAVGGHRYGSLGMPAGNGANQHNMGTATLPAKPWEVTAHRGRGDASFQPQNGKRDFKSNSAVDFSQWAPASGQEQFGVPSSGAGASLGLGESMWSDNPHSPSSVTSPDPTFAEWQAGKKAHVNYFKMPNSLPSVHLVLRNIPYQMDTLTLKKICYDCGSVEDFNMNSSTQTCLVRYHSIGEATEAKLKMERALNYSFSIEFASNTDIGEFFGNAAASSDRSSPPLSFTARKNSGDAWTNAASSGAMASGNTGDLEWYSSMSAPMEIAAPSQSASNSAWKGNDLFSAWGQTASDSATTTADVPSSSNDTGSHLATSPSMATFLPNDLF